MKSIFSLFAWISLMIFGCAGTPRNGEAIPVHETFTIESRQLDEARIINVWVPDQELSDSLPLPVMYMADGGIEEDFPHIAQTFSALIKAKKIPPFMLVGIENTQRRRDLTGFTKVEKDKEVAPVVGGSAKFRAFINEELMPEIQRKYRTTDKKGILGESLSGLFVMETFFLQPEMFDYYIAFDPSLWWNDHSLVRTASAHLAKLPTEPKVLWFAGANTADIFPYTRLLAKILENEPPANLTWMYSDEPEEAHSTIFKATKEKALTWTLTRNH